jgi:hypothetical protein
MRLGKEVTVDGRVELLHVLSVAKSLIPMDFRHWVKKLALRRFPQEFFFVVFYLP